MREAATERTELLGGRYRLIEQLGAGGMAVVWRGYDELLGRPVAVKMLAARFAGDRAFRRRIRAEAQAAARLCHPHITNVYDYGEILGEGGPVPYVVMELVDGDSLATYLSDGRRLPWRAAVIACAEVAAALAAAHARGVVHRDVTPGNVMLTRDGVKVVDFGISAVVGTSDVDPDGQLLGTPAYLAPERLDAGQVTPATDVYAVGLLLYRSLTGRLPWKLGSTTQLLRAHRHADPAPMPPLPGLPEEVVALCRRCLAKNPADRPASAEVARVLAAAAGAERRQEPAERLREPDLLPTRGLRTEAVPAGAPDAEPLVDADPLPAAGPLVDAESLPDRADTTILPWSIATDALPPVAWRTGDDPGRRHGARPGRRGGRRRGRYVPGGGRGRLTGRAAGAAVVGAGLLLVTGLAWALPSQTPANGQDQRVGLGAGAPEPAGCEVEYALRTDTGRTFDADVTVTNTGDSALTDWRLSFAFPGDQTITGGASAQWQQEGQQVRLAPAADQPASLDPGATRSMRLTGRYVTGNPLPVRFRLDDVTCEVRVSGAAGDGADAATANAAEQTTSGRSAQSGSGGPKSGGSGSGGSGSGASGKSGKSGKSGPGEPGAGPAKGKEKAPKPPKPGGGHHH